jgi:hypothetical protein
VPTHAIADQEHPSIDVQGVGILVVLTHLPYMGRRSADDRGSPGHWSTLH